MPDSAAVSCIYIYVKLMEKIKRSNIITKRSGDCKDKIGVYICTCIYRLSEVIKKWLSECSRNRSCGDIVI